MNQLEVVWSIEKYIMNTTNFFFFHHHGYA